MAGDLTIVVLIAVAAALAALHTVKRIITPLAGLRRHAVEVGRGNLGHRVEVADTAELAEVGEAFNRMTEEAQAREHERELRLEAERERAALAEGLAEEISHQVRNNLAMVSGLLQMQLLKYRNTTVEPLLRAAVLRIQSFADIHEEIHAARSTELDLLSTLRRLATSVSRRYGEGARPVISVEGDPLRYDARIVTNLAIAAGELVTNAVKYGGPGADGQVEVRVNCSAADGQLRLSVWNSGLPVPVDFDPAKQGAMGLQIVWDLVVSRYGGTFTLTPREGGSLAEIRVSEAALREKT
jgi:two-component sensor histidine kinase